MPSCLLSWAALTRADIAKEIYCVYFVYTLIRSPFMSLTWHLHKKSLIKYQPSTEINTRLKRTVTFRLKLSAFTYSGCVHLRFAARRRTGLLWGLCCSRARRPSLKARRELPPAPGSRHSWDGAFPISARFDIQQQQPRRCAEIKALTRNCFFLSLQFHSIRLPDSSELQTSVATVAET